MTIKLLSKFFSRELELLILDKITISQKEVKDIYQKVIKHINGGRLWNSCIYGLQKGLRRVQSYEHRISRRKLKYIVDNSVDIGEIGIIGNEKNDPTECKILSKVIAKETTVKYRVNIKKDIFAVKGLFNTNINLLLGIKTKPNIDISILFNGMGHVKTITDNDGYLKLDQAICVKALSYSCITIGLDSNIEEIEVEGICLNTDTYRDILKLSSVTSLWKFHKSMQNFVYYQTGSLFPKYKA